MTIATLLQDYEHREGANSAFCKTTNENFIGFTVKGQTSNLPDLEKEFQKKLYDYFSKGEGPIYWRAPISIESAEGRTVIHCRCSRLPKKPERVWSAPVHPVRTGMNFGSALAEMRAGNGIARDGWMENNAYLKMQQPDPESKMTRTYLYMSHSNGDLAPYSLTNEDLFANDWMT